MTDHKAEGEAPNKIPKTEENTSIHSANADVIKHSDAREEKEKKCSKRKKEYKKLRYKGIVYEIGNPVLIKHEDDTNTIGRLKKIIAKGGLSENLEWPSVDVQCYYKKDKIKKEKNNIDKAIYDNIGDNELFETDEITRVFVDTINGICRIWSLDEYDGRKDLSSEYDYFTRGVKYDYKAELLQPPIKDWVKVCNCKMPLNPNEFFIGCEKCETWFHPRCVGLTNVDAEKIEKFYCESCRPSSKPEVAPIVAEIAK